MFEEISWLLTCLNKWVKQFNPNITRLTKNINPNTSLHQTVIYENQNMKEPYLYILLPSSSGQLALSQQLSKLSRIISIINRSGPQPITNRQSNIILVTNIKNIIPMIISKILLMVSQTPFRMNRPAPRNNPRHPLSR
ncbi:hypothetical protein Hanom_Chr01g00032941 [Helianthus anomalus]